MLRDIQRFFFRTRRHRIVDPIFAGADIDDATRKISANRRYEWVESMFASDSAGVSAVSNKNYLGRVLSGRRLFVCFFVLSFFVLGLLGRAFYLQVTAGDYYSGVAERNRVRVLNLPAPRGIIYDRNGVALVKNVPDFAVYVLPADFRADAQAQARNIDWLKTQLGAENISVALEEILSIAPTAREYFEPMLLADNVEYKKAVAMIVASDDYPGVSVSINAQREYLSIYDGRPITSLAHVIGYVGRINQAEYAIRRDAGYLSGDYIGKTGIEASFEIRLRGKYGKEQIEVDAMGRPKQIIAKEDLRKGDNLYLSIDIKMQAELESIIRRHLSAMAKTRAASIVLNPQNGEVLAMVSYPAFDANLFSQGVSQSQFSSLLNNPNLPLLNRVLSGEYQSGSIIKPVIGATALQEGVINEFTSFVSAGGLRLTQWFFPDWKAGGHGVTDIRKALAESVNTFFYIIGGGYQGFSGLGVERIKKYAEMFGLNKLTGIDLPNEKTGFLPTAEWKFSAKKEQWYVGDTYHLAIGEGDLLITPLQAVAYTACFANGGTMYKPQVIKQYYDQAKRQMVLGAVEINNANFIDSKNIAIIRQGMRQAVTRGTAKILNGLSVASGAKTGTAQWQTGKTPHSWFIAFAPYEDAQLAMATLVEEGGEGTAIAAPITFEFMNWYFRIYKH